MDTQILDRFKNYVRDNYNNPDLISSVICSDIHCSRDSLHRAATRKYNYSSMRYVGSFRILKTMELISM